MGILEGRTVLVAGVTMDTSIGFATARVAQEQGAKVLVSNFGDSGRVEAQKLLSVSLEGSVG